MSKSKLSLVLESLEKGGEIKFEGKTLVMSTDNKLCLLGTKTEMGKTEEILLYYDISFNNFVDWCEKLKNEDIPLSIPHLKNR